MCMRWWHTRSFPRERLCSICVMAPARNSAKVSALLPLPRKVTVEGTLEPVHMCSMRIL
jgi:hypothetical protein